LYTVFTNVYRGKFPITLKARPASLLDEECLYKEKTRAPLPLGMDERPNPLARLEHSCYTARMRAGDEPAFGGLRASKEYLAQPNVLSVLAGNPLPGKTFAVFLDVSKYLHISAVVPVDTRQVARPQAENPLALAVGCVIRNYDATRCMVAP